ncbi:MAG: hypothetical protein AABX96_04560 [Nanoarchaeota archaeon]
MSFSFKYKAVQLKSGKFIFRPMIPLAIGEEKINVFRILDSGSDITIIPKELAEVMKIDYGSENEVSGISGVPVKSKEGRINVHFGKGREFYNFDIPILVPEKEGLNFIIGRLGFFEMFKIIFLEAERRIEFKKINLG